MKTFVLILLVILIASCSTQKHFAEQQKYYQDRYYDSTFFAWSKHRAYVLNGEKAARAENRKRWVPTLVAGCITGYCIFVSKQD